MSGLNPDWDEDAERARALQQTSGLPPAARPGSATQQRIEDIKVQTGLRGLSALRNPGTPDDAEPDSV